MTVEAGLVVAGAAALIPILNAVISRIHAAGWQKTLVSVLLAGLTAVGAKYVGVDGIVGIKDIIVVFAGSLFLAGGARLSSIGTVEEMVAYKTQNFGIGQKGAPSLDPDYPKVEEAEKVY